MRRYVAFAATLVLLLLGPQAVLAQYGPGGHLTVSDANPPAGGQVTVSGDGFGPSSPVRITIGASCAPALLATATTDATGAFSASVTIPMSASGSCTLTATGTDPSGSVLALTSAIKVAAATITNPPTAATPVSSTGRSGSDALVIAIAGAGIVLMTGILLLATSKRRSLR